MVKPSLASRLDYESSVNCLMYFNELHPQLFVLLYTALFSSFDTGVETNLTTILVQKDITAVKQQTSPGIEKL